MAQAADVALNREGYLHRSLHCMVHTVRLSDQHAMCDLGEDISRDRD